MIQCGFFNAIDGDRTYDANDMGKPWDILVSEGISPADRTHFKVTTYGSNFVRVLPGKGIFNGKWLILTDYMLLELDPALGRSRYDSIIIKVDNTGEVRDISIEVKQGSYSSPPTLTKDGSVQEYRLANVLMTPGQTHISSEAIEDTRDSSECGWLASLISEVNITSLWENWSATLNLQMSQMSDTISQQTSLINEMEETIEELQNTIQTAQHQVISTITMPDGACITDFVASHAGAGYSVFLFTVLNPSDAPMTPGVGGFPWNGVVFTTATTNGIGMNTSIIIWHPLSSKHYITHKAIGASGWHWEEWAEV